jgi:hypothetical protein
MNIEKICSPYTNVETLASTLDHSHVNFKRGVFDICTAFNYYADCPEKAAPARNQVKLLTQNGWVAGVLTYHKDYSEEDAHFKFRSPMVKKARSDGRSDRSERAANKMKDLIKVLRMKKELMTDELAFMNEIPAMKYAFGMIDGKLERNPPPVIVLRDEMVVAVSRAILHDAPFPEMLRSDMALLYKDYQDKYDAYEELCSSKQRFQNCTAIGILQVSETKSHYFVGKVQRIKTGSGSGAYKIETQGPMKRYVSLDEAGLGAQGAIIRTYMQGKPYHDTSNELYVRRTDEYYEEIDVATGYSGEALTWALLPEMA